MLGLLPDGCTGTGTSVGGGGRLSITGGGKSTGKGGGKFSKGGGNSADAANEGGGGKVMGILGPFGPTGNPFLQ